MPVYRIRAYAKHQQTHHYFDVLAKNPDNALKLLKARKIEVGRGRRSMGPLSRYKWIAIVVDAEGVVD